MQKKVFVDTSTLILLSKINELPILKLVYGIVFITSEVFDEFNGVLPKWVVIDNLNSQQYQFPMLGLGESSLCSVAYKNNSVFLILDDLKARKIAAKFNINYTGTIGVIIAAKKLGYIHSIKPFILKINSTNFRLSTEVQSKALELAGE